MRSVADQSSEPPGLHLVPGTISISKHCVPKEPESCQVFLVSLTRLWLIMEVINVYKSFWYPISCCQTRSGSSFLRVVWVLGSWSLWVLGNLLCLTPHMASSPPFLFSYRPLLPLLSLISFSVLHSIDVISSSNRPLLFHSLIYSSLFLSLWFWRFYVFYHFYMKHCLFLFLHFLFCRLILTLSVYSVTSSLWVSCFCLIVEALL